MANINNLDLSGSHLDNHKKYEKEIYYEFGKLVIESESISYTLINMISWFYADFGMTKKSHAIQIMLNKENHSKLLDIFTNTIEYLFEINEKEKKILKNWKKEIRMISEFRNKLVHSQWSFGFFSQIKEWDSIEIISSQNKKVGDYSENISLENIKRQRDKLHLLETEILCIFRCLVTYKKSFIEYFDFKDDITLFDYSKWTDFTNNNWE